MSASTAAKEAGLKSLADLVTLSGIPRRTLIDWHAYQPRKFDLALKGVLYEIGRKHVET